MMIFLEKSEKMAFFINKNTVYRTVFWTGCGCFWKEKIVQKSPLFWDLIFLQKYDFFLMSSKLFFDFSAPP